MQKAKTQGNPPEIRYFAFRAYQKGLYGTKPPILHSAQLAQRAAQAT